MNTFLLDLTNWDLVTDTHGNLAVATDPYAVAQDVASAIKVFQRDLWYNQTVGIPYFEQVLGHLPSVNFLKSQIAGRAGTVPGCNNPVVFLAALKNRVLTGQVQFTDSNGTAQVTAFSLSTNRQLRDSGGNLIFDNSGNPVYGSYA